MQQQKKTIRNQSIDILKFLAVIFITNSHFDEQYVYAKEFATGGAIGDALFFFCSGYTLFIGRLGRFDSWYKRRIRRIYPSVFALAIVTSFIYGLKYDMFDIWIQGGEWFVSCIMIYYVFLYFIRRYALKHLGWVYVILTVAILIWYIWFFEPKNVVWMYKWTYFKWLFYFLFMLLGAQIGLKEKEEGVTIVSAKKTIVKLLLSIFFFYGILFFCEMYPNVGYLQIVSLLPLVGVCIYFYNMCQALKNRILRNPWIVAPILTVGGLCLEIYLIQPLVRTTALNFLFPLNLLLLFVAIVFAAYGVRCLAHIFQQTFSNEDGYDWKAILRLY
jgi:peptidoglycan/LPS O-acetylase OafA/YrhL